MKHVLRALLLVCLLAPILEARDIRPLEDHVVSLSVTWQSYNTYRPWEKGKPGHRSAQALVVKDSLLLTTAHAVSNATFIEVKKHGKSTRTQAQIFHMDREINLALLTVSKPGFFKDLQGVSFPKDMVSKGKARSARWNNRQLEVAQTRLGRAAVVSSQTGSVQHTVLKGTTDLSDRGAADPVFLGNTVIGLTISQSKQSVEILPAHTLVAYCDMATSGNYHGFATLRGLSYQVQNDATVGKWLDLAGEPRGILVRNAPYGETGHGLLKPLDLLLSIDGHSIDSQGYYAHPQYGQLHFLNIVTEGHVVGDTVKIILLRKGETLDLEMSLIGFPLKHRLIPYWRSDYRPPYLVAGGLVFRELDYNYLRARGKNWRSKSDTRLLLYWDLERFDQTSERRKIIVLSHVLPDTYNIGYHDLKDLAVKKVNGRQVGSLTTLATAFRLPQKGFHIIEFEKNYSRDRVVLAADTYHEATQRILENYHIPQGK